MSTSTRRTFLRRSAGGIAALGAAGTVFSACGGGGSDGQVNVLSFQSYIDPEIKKLWSQAYPEITLVGTPAGNDAELFTKLKAGGTDAYDVVFTDFGYCPLYEREGLIELLDLSKLKAGAELFPQFREDVDAFPYLTAPDRAIAFPCQWAPTSLTFNTTVDFVPDAPYSWSQLWDPAIPGGKVGFYGLPPEGFIATAALALGIAPSRVFGLSESELAKVVAYFREVKPFKTYEADPLARNAIRTETVWASLVPTPGFASKINEEAGEEVSESVIPEEGSIGFIDGPMLVKGAKNRANGLKFIEWFASDPKVRDYVFNAYRAAPCSKTTVDRLLAEGGESAEIVKILKGPEPEIATKVVQGQPPADVKAYTAAWDEILA